MVICTLANLPIHIRTHVGHHACTPTSWLPIFYYIPEPWCSLPTSLSTRYAARVDNNGAQHPHTRRQLPLVALLDAGALPTSIFVLHPLAIVTSTPTAPCVYTHYPPMALHIMTLGVASSPYDRERV